MNRTLPITILVITLILNALPVKSQDPQFSQFYAIPLYLAPSFAGASEGSRIVLNYRNQWSSIPGAFNSYSASYDQYFPQYNSGAGLVLFRDAAGSGNLASTEARIVYSYNIQITRFWHVRPGIHFLYSYRSINFSKLTMVDGDQIVPATQSNSFELKDTKERHGYYDAAASVLAYNRRHWIGATCSHLVKPNQSLTGIESKVRFHWTGFGGTKIGINGRLGKYNEESISLAFLYKMQAKYDQLDIGAYWFKNSSFVISRYNTALIIGAWYRGIPFMKKEGFSNYDAAIVMVGLKLEDDWKFGYSYDFTVSKLFGSTNGSHEFSVIYEFGKDRKRRRRRKSVVPCPKF